jgi:hypothetical protein
MRKYILSFLAVSALSLSFGIVKPMMVRFNGKTGAVISKDVHTMSQVNAREAQFLNHINDLDRISANVMVLQNGNGYKTGDIVVYLTW